MIDILIPLKRVRNPIAREQNMVIVVELCRDHVAQSMVFFIEGKNGGIGDAYTEANQNDHW